jgi:hypothetical protein
VGGLYNRASLTFSPLSLQNALAHTVQSEQHHLGCSQFWGVGVKYCQLVHFLEGFSSPVLGGGKKNNNPPLVNKA